MSKQKTTNEIMSVERGYLEAPNGQRIEIAGDKRFVIDCYGDNWSLNWLKQSDVSLKDFFEMYDVKITEMHEEEVVYRP